MGEIRFTITFSGRVQGVGFRFTTCRIARGFDVSGWVRNEPDGTVACVAQGEEQEVESFVAAIKEAMAGNIHETRVTRTPAGPDLSGFHVRY